MLENKIQWLLLNQRGKCITDERGLAPSPLFVGHIPADIQHTTHLVKCWNAFMCCRKYDYYKVHRPKHTGVNLTPKKSRVSI